MSPATLAFLAELFRWTLAPLNPADYADTLRMPRDGGIPPFAMVGARPGGAAAPTEQVSASGMAFEALLPQKLRGGDVPVPVVAFSVERWPLTFGLHNARIRAEAGRAAVLDQWVAYAGRGRFKALQSGSYTFNLTFRSPRETSCYAFLVFGGAELFPDHDRTIRRKVPPRIVMAPGERRVFQRGVTVPVAGVYDLELTVGCHPGRKPDVRIERGELEAWQAVEVGLQVITPGDRAPRDFTAGELVQPLPQ